MERLPRPADRVIDRTRYVYLAELGQRDEFKIGYSIDLPARQRTLRCQLAAPDLRIRWCAIGSLVIEARLHAEFADLAIGRELFKFTGRDALVEVAAAYRKWSTGR